MKSPKAPNPVTTANAQAASNRDTAITQQLLNMTNQVTPDGSLKYSQSGEATIIGSDGKQYKVPTFTGTQTLSAGQQHLYDQNMQADTQMNDIALGQIDRIGNHLSTPFSYDTGDHEAWAGDLYGKLNNDTNQRNTALMEQKLANQGLQPGSEAYDAAMRNLVYGQEKGRNDFMLNSYDEGMNTALTNRNQPLNEIASLTSGTGVQQPQFVNTPNTGVNGTDVAGLINANYQAKLGQQQSFNGGLAGLGSAALGGWAMSDERLKTDVQKVGEFEDGINKYSFRYKGSPLKRLGAMAQEVKKTKPEAVAKTQSGYYAVNYDKLKAA